MKFKIAMIIMVIVILTTSCSRPINYKASGEQGKIENPHNNLETKIIDLTFDSIPIEKLQEGEPNENWVRRKSIYFGDLPHQIESTIHLYLENSSEKDSSSEETIYGLLEHEGKMYNLGYVSNYGIEDVNISLADRNSDGVKEIYVIGRIGAAYVEMKAIGYDGKNKEWVNLLTMGTPNIIDLDNDGQDELVATSAGSLPGYVDIYKWNYDHFEKASILDSTGNTYANLFFEDGNWVIESGKLEDGKVTGPYLYRYSSGKLIFDKK